MVRAWYMDDSTTDQRETHMTQPPNFVSLDELKKIGVNYWQVMDALIADLIFSIAQYILDLW